VSLAEDQHSVGELGSDGHTNRSAKQFACGQPGGIFTTVMSASARTASKDVVN
jgi:hypothetical protein